QRRPARAVAALEGDRGVRHALGVRIRVSVAAHRRHGGTPRPRRLRDRHRRALSAAGGVPDLARIRRLVRQGFGPARRGDGGMTARIVAPLVLGVLMLGLWEALVRAFAIPPYILPGPLLIAETLVTDWGTLLPSLLVTVRITLEALAAAVLIGGLLA